ncbi:hypothetical protein LTR15_005542 [Elasticomyces elasticus]|nr:hypothetical protein LTR15_005542 [Elasticomyces elasticus]
MASSDEHRSETSLTESDALPLSRLNLNDNNTTEDEQQPPIFRIAAELRNRIYELALPSSTTIPLRLENITAASKPTIRFHPALPPLYYLCRRTHNEFPLYQYYTNNTFLFTGPFLSLRILDTLVATRGEAIKTITSAKVTLVTDWIADVERGLSKKVTIRFMLIKPSSTAAVEVRNLTTTSSFGSSEDLCFCGTLSKSQQDFPRDSSVFGTLRTFVARFESVTQPARTESITQLVAKAGDSLFDRECAQCGKKTIHRHVRSRMTREAVPDAPREQHDRDPIVPQNWYDDFEG